MHVGEARATLLSILYMPCSSSLVRTVRVSCISLQMWAWKHLRPYFLKSLASWKSLSFILPSLTSLHETAENRKLFFRTYIALSAPTIEYLFFNLMFGSFPDRPQRLHTKHVICLKALRSSGSNNEKELKFFHYYHPPLQKLVAKHFFAVFSTVCVPFNNL